MLARDAGANLAGVWKGGDDLGTLEVEIRGHLRGQLACKVSQGTVCFLEHEHLDWP